MPALKMENGRCARNKAAPMPSPLVVSMTLVYAFIGACLGGWMNCDQRARPLGLADRL
jgi:hypothetical protein